MGTLFAARTVLRSAGAVAVRPRLWPTAAAQLARFAPDRWWRRAPFIPLPTPELTGFRAETMYGDPDVPPSPADVVVWLEWCRVQNRRQAGSTSGRSRSG